MCNVNCIRCGADNLSRKEIKGQKVLEVGSYDVNGSLRYIVKLLEQAGLLKKTFQSTNYTP